MKTVTVEGKRYLIVPGNGCQRCALPNSLEGIRCSIRFPELVNPVGWIVCGTVANDGVNHILRPDTPEERAEAFARKVSEL